jgi:hypothetical protein
MAISTTFISGIFSPVSLALAELITVKLENKASTNRLIDNLFIVFMLSFFYVFNLLNYISNIPEDKMFNKKIKKLNKNYKELKKRI